MEDESSAKQAKTKKRRELLVAVTAVVDELVPSSIASQVTSEQVSTIMTRTESSGDEEPEKPDVVVEKEKPPAAEEAAKRRDEAINLADFSKSFWVETKKEPGVGTFKTAYTYVTFDDGLRVCVVGKIRPLCAGNSFIPGVEGSEMLTPAKHVPVIDGLKTGGTFPEGDRYPSPPWRRPAPGVTPSFVKDSGVKGGYRQEGFTDIAGAIGRANFAASVYVNVSAKRGDTKQAYTYVMLADGFRICVVGHVHPLRGRGIRVVGVPGENKIAQGDIDAINGVKDKGSKPGADDTKPQWT